MTPRPKFATAFTHAGDEGMIPPQFVVGELVVRHVSADYNQYFVDGTIVDLATVTPISNPTPELVRALQEKRAQWARHDQKLAARRNLKDDSFREEHEDEESEAHLVREDQMEAFIAFCDEVSRENQRLTAERQAEVADLVKQYQRPAR